VSCGEAGDVCFAAGAAEVQPALFYAIEKHADQVGKTHRGRHVRIELTRHLSQILELAVGEHQRFQFVGASRRSFWQSRYEIHGRALNRGVSGARKSLPSIQSFF
jgi:hypothetical protein